MKNFSIFFFFAQKETVKKKKKVFNRKKNKKTKKGKNKKKKKEKKKSPARRRSTKTICGRSTHCPFFCFRCSADPESEFLSCKQIQRRHDDRRRGVGRRRSHALPYQRTIQCRSSAVVVWAAAEATGKTKGQGEQQTIIYLLRI